MGEVILRRAAPGDLGWIVSRHGVLYAQEFGWKEGLEVGEEREDWPDPVLQTWSRRL